MSLLKEAEELINGQRREDYGDAKASFERIAQLWSTYLGKGISSHDVVAMMILFKINRICHSNHHLDSWKDLIGYAALTERL